MPLINTANALYLGDTAVKRAYLGESLVWPSGDASPLVVSLAKVAGQAQVTISTSYNGLEPDWYKFYLSESGGAWVFKWEGASGGPHTFNVAYSKQYQAKGESFKNAVLLNTALSGLVTTDPAPPPPTQQKVWESYNDAGLSHSFQGDGSIRTGTENYYSGNLGSGDRGTQKSAFYFPIPADVRWCKSIDKVEFSCLNLHTYNNLGVQQHLAITHTAPPWGSWPGATGAMSSRWTSKGGYYGDSPSGWVDVTNDVDPTLGRTVADNIRTRNAQGICLVAPGDGTSYYSYWSERAILRITYTVYT